MAIMFLKRCPGNYNPNDEAPRQRHGHNKGICGWKYLHAPVEGVQERSSRQSTAQSMTKPATPTICSKRYPYHPRSRKQQTGNWKLTPLNPVGNKAEPRSTSRLPTTSFRSRRRQPTLLAATTIHIRHPSRPGGVRELVMVNGCGRRNRQRTPMAIRRHHASRANATVDSQSHDPRRISATVC